jgi:L-ascorbate metabolism protein UlaG (beta-lactamase superfamily)
MPDSLIFYGHASFGLSLGEHTILVDPFFLNNPATSIDPGDLSADFILISHAHHDHIEDVYSIAERTGALCISVVEITKQLSKKGLNTHGQHIGGGYHHPFGYLKLTQAAHGSGFPDGSYGGDPSGLLITTLQGKKIYFAADTGLFGDMRLIGDEGIDIAALPIGDNFTMGPDDALKAVKLLEPKEVIPFHYNTWDTIQQDAPAWAKRVEEESQAKVHLLKAGDSLAI